MSQDPHLISADFLHAGYTSADSEFVMKSLDSVEDGEPIVVIIQEGQTAWDPSSTKRKLWGPSKVTYIRFPDGGVSAREEIL